MKKHYLAIIFLFVAVGTWAQVPYRTFGWNQTLQAPINPNVEQLRHDYQQRCKSSTDRTLQYWVSYALSVDSINYGAAVHTGNYLFPDSNVNVNFVDVNGDPVEGSPFIHQIVDILDPLSVVFQIVDGVTFTSSDAYYVDSAAVALAYSRHTDASVVDTLIIYLYQGPVPNVHTGNLPEYIFTSQLPDYDVFANWGVDTLHVPLNKYDYPTNKPSVVSASDLKTFKFPLTESDSSSFFYFKFFATNKLQVDSGNKVAMVMAFKPGYTYTPFENVDSNKNTFFFLSYQESLNGFQTYYQGEYNVSSVLPTFVRYDLDPNGFNGFYVPSYAWFPPPYPWQHHLFAYFLSDEPIGINEPNPVLSNILVTPNPSAGFAQVNFSLNNSSNIRIELNDIAGKLINAFSIGKLSKGNHSQVIDVSKLPAGVYTVSVVSGEQKATQKLMVGQ